MRSGGTGHFQCPPSPSPSIPIQTSVGECVFLKAEVDLANDLKGFLFIKEQHC